MEGGELKRQRRESIIQVTQGDTTIIVQDSAQIFFVLLCVFFLSSFSFFSFFLQKNRRSFFLLKILPFSSASLLEWYYTFDATLREKKKTRKNAPRDERSA